MYGGSAIIYRANLASVILIVSVLLIWIYDVVRKLLVISLHLPTDYGMSAGEHSFLHRLNELGGFVSAKRCDYLLTAGDFNVDFSRIHRQCTSFLADMTKDFNLEACSVWFL